MQIFVRMIFLLCVFIFISCMQSETEQTYPINPQLGFSTGPALNEKVPEFSLPDQSGEVKILRELVGENGAVLNFFRSASWWPFCKRELVEFQNKLNEFQDQGITIIGVSYDPVEVLQSFSEKYQIKYPLLSDTGSKIIRKYGILNASIDSSKKSYGIPNPGFYIIDKNLKVVSKQFEPAYSTRPTAENVLATHFNQELKSFVQTFKTPYLQASVAVSDTVAYRGQLLTVTASFHLKEGFHMYGEPIPEGYFPLTITFQENPNFSVDVFQFPETKEITLPSIDETFHVLPGDLYLKTFIRISNRPEYGNFSLSAVIKFQACDDKVCMPPEEFQIQFPISLRKSSL